MRPPACPICLEYNEQHTFLCKNIKVCTECWKDVKVLSSVKTKCPVCLNCTFRLPDMQSQPHPQKYPQLV